MIEIQREEALAGCIAELPQRNASVEVGVGRRDRLGKVQQTEACGSAIGFVAIVPEAASAAMMAAATMMTASASAAASVPGVLRLSAFDTGEFEMRPA
jgi:hypothetical protein